MKLDEGTAIEVSACAFLLNCSIYPVIYAGFFEGGVHQMFGKIWGPVKFKNVNHFTKISRMCGFGQKYNNN